MRLRLRDRFVSWLLSSERRLTSSRVNRPVVPHPPSPPPLGTLAALPGRVHPVAKEGVGADRIGFVRGLAQLASGFLRRASGGANWLRSGPYPSCQWLRLGAARGPDWLRSGFAHLANGFVWRTARGRIGFVRGGGSGGSSGQLFWLNYLID